MSICRRNYGKSVIFACKKPRRPETHEQCSPAFAFARNGTVIRLEFMALTFLPLAFRIKIKEGFFVVIFRSFVRSSVKEKKKNRTAPVEQNFIYYLNTETRNGPVTSSSHCA